MAIVDDLDAPELDDGDRYHLERVLRLRPGAAMVVCDGAGRWRTARFADRPDELGEVHQVEPPAPTLAVAFALVKGDRPELVTQKLTEIGVDVIVPFLSERSVVRWDAAKAQRQHVRLSRVAREACLQSRRPLLPVVAPLCRFGAITEGSVAELAGFDRSEVALADVDGEPLASIAGPAPRVVLIGPEGGWSDAERASTAGRIGLGDHVLRAETAAIVAAAGLVARHRGRSTHAHGG